MAELNFRYSEPEDVPFLREWFQEPGVLRDFPMWTPLELTDTINRWMSYNRFGSCLTAEVNGKVGGMALFWLSFYEKMRHQALLTIIVAPEFRGKGVGTELLRTLLDLGKNKLKLTMAHLEVYEGNPAINLYRRMGFKEIGFQKMWSKDQGEFVGRIMMQKDL